MKFFDNSLFSFLFANGVAYSAEASPKRNHLIVTTRKLNAPVFYGQIILLVHSLGCKALDLLPIFKPYSLLTYRAAAVCAIACDFFLYE